MKEMSPLMMFGLRLIFLLGSYHTYSVESYWWSAYLFCNGIVIDVRVNREQG